MERVLAAGPLLSPSQLCPPTSSLSRVDDFGSHESLHRCSAQLLHRSVFHHSHVVFSRIEVLMNFLDAL